VSSGTLRRTPSHLSRTLCALTFFACALTAVGQAPEKMTTDGHDSYPRAVRETLGPDVCHRPSRYMNNRIEQDHRGIKQRYYPMRGFGSFASAARFCTAHDELRDHLRPRTRFNEAVSLAAQRRLFGGALGRGVRAAASRLTTPAPALPQPNVACCSCAV